MTIYDIDPTELVEEVAKELQKIESIKPPKWASFVKTGANRERPPAREDWWHVRAASVLRKVRLKGPIGVSKLKTLYGGIKNRGHAPERFKRGSGNIIRKILQQLEKAELLKKGEKGVHKGRLITPKGIKLMNNVANRIYGNKPAKKIEVKPEVKDMPKKKEEPKLEKKTEELVKKTKEFAQGKIPTAKKLVEEAIVPNSLSKSRAKLDDFEVSSKAQTKKEKKEAPKEKKEQVIVPNSSSRVQTKKEEKKPIEKNKKEAEKIPTVAELAEKKSAEK